jgi:hypothetical protein
MPSSVGPNTFGEENLVFGYDLGDVSNSYRGEPTANLATLDLSNTSKWYSEGGTKVLQSETLDGYPVYQFRSSGSLIYVSPVAFNQLTATSNDVTLSAYFKNVGTTAQSFNVYLARDFSTDSNGVANTRSIPADGKWYRHSWTSYAAANLANQVEFRTFSDTLLISKPQVEYKKHATPPVEGTRSATEGLLDLTGNSTIDLTNVSFDSNAQMTFDGTNDQFVISNPGVGTSFSIEIIIKVNSYDNSPIFISPASVGIDHFFRVNSNGNIFARFVEIADSSADDYTSLTVLNSANYYHVLISKSPSNGTIYVNGVAEDSHTPTLPAAAWSDDWRIGARWNSTFWFNGELPLFKVYSRALTASEVKSNYNAIKGRFSIL